VIRTTSSAAEIEQPKSLELKFISKHKLPISPDNIMVDYTDPTKLIIAGHPLTYMFIAHAALSVPAPSAVIQYDIASDATQYLYMDDGRVISASSVAVHIRSATGRDELFIGQVFSPFILRCSW
jgi:hypothetical protein